MRLTNAHLSASSVPSPARRIQSARERACFRLLDHPTSDPDHPLGDMTRNAQKPLLRLEVLRDRMSVQTSNERVPQKFFADE